MELWRNPTKAPELIRAYEIMFGLTEVLIEAGPTTLIILVILVRDPSFFLEFENPYESSLVSNDTVFHFGFISSFLSASFGLAKALRYGICRTMADADAVDLLTGRFLMAFLSCGLVVVSKGVMIAMIVSNIGSYFPYDVRGRRKFL